jgi:hypothetical protein
VLSPHQHLAVSLTREDSCQVVGQLTAGEVQLDDCVGQHAPVVDGHCLGHTVAGLEHDTSGAAGGVEREDSLQRATASPQRVDSAVVRVLLRTWMATYMAGTLKLSNMTCNWCMLSQWRWWVRQASKPAQQTSVAFSLLELGLSGASVSSTACS